MFLAGPAAICAISPFVPYELLWSAHKIILNKLHQFLYFGTRSVMIDMAYYKNKLLLFLLLVLLSTCIPFNMLHCACFVSSTSATNVAISEPRVSPIWQTLRVTNVHYRIVINTKKDCEP